MAARDAARTLPLPTSALLDPTLPMLSAHALSLRPPEPEVAQREADGEADAAALGAGAAGAIAG